MAYLGVDVERVGSLSENLRSAAAVAGDAQHYLTQAELLADLPVGCNAPLREIADDFNRMAEHIDWAADRVRGLRITFAAMFDWPEVPAPVRTPVPILPPAPVPATPAAFEAISPQWDAVSGQPWDQVHQVSSHNSYEVPGGIQVLFDQGVRSFELDVHRRAPVDLWSPLGPRLTASWLGSGDGATSEATPQWHVYHATGLSFSEYEGLGEGLAAVAALHTSDPLTVFIDIKDGFDGSHTFDAFDQVLVDQLGERLYSPATFQSRAAEMGALPDATTLLESAQLAGWPDVDELRGRVIVVLTDEIDGYSRPTAQAFVAPPPEFEQSASGAVQHVPRADAIFYNANDRRIEPTEIAAVHATGTVLRTYFNPRCETSLLGLASPTAHYRAVDVGAGDPPCPAHTLAPPVQGPGPG